MRKILVCLLALTIAACEWNSIPPPDARNATVDSPGLTLTRLNPGPTHGLTAIFFSSVTTGYISTRAGSIYKTVDGGNTWKQQNTGNTQPLFDMFFINDATGYAVGGNEDCAGSGCTPTGPVMLRTSDGGQTWTKVRLNLSFQIELESIWFADEAIGFAVGTNLILSTTDGGASWNEKDVDIGALLMDVEFIGKKKGLVTGTFGRLLRTLDGGETWTSSIPYPELGANDLAVVSQDLVFSAGYLKMQKSTDFGITWTDVRNGPADIFEVVFTTGEIGYAFGRGKYCCGDFGEHQGSVYYTADGGETWKGSDDVGVTGVLESASFPAINTGYAVSQNAVIRIERR